MNYGLILQKSLTTLETLSLSILKQGKGQLLFRLAESDVQLKESVRKMVIRGWVVQLEQAYLLNSASPEVERLLSIPYVMPESYKGGRIYNYLVGKHMKIKDNIIPILNNKTMPAVQEFLATFAGTEADLYNAVAFYYDTKKFAIVGNKRVYDYVKLIPALLEDKILLNNLLYSPVQTMVDDEL